MREAPDSYTAGRETLEDPPRANNLKFSVEDIYQQFVAEIASESLLTASIAECTFYWLVFGLEPLRAQDIIAALCLGLSEVEEAMRPLDASMIGNCCKGLVSFVSPDELHLV